MGPTLKLTLDDLQELARLIGEDTDGAGAWVDDRVRELIKAREQLLREGAP